MLFYFFYVRILQLESELTLDKLLEWTRRDKMDMQIDIGVLFAKVQAGGWELPIRNTSRDGYELCLPGNKGWSDRHEQ